jgi:hypothetical protein
MKGKEMKRRIEQKKQSAKESFHFLRFFFPKLCSPQFWKKNWKNFFKSKYKRIFPKVHILHFLKKQTFWKKRRVFKKSKEEEKENFSKTQI